MTPERARVLVDNIQSNTATAEERLEYVIAELRDALDSGDPPAEGHVSDSFHASCCVLRAWAILTAGQADAS